MTCSSDPVKTGHLRICFENAIDFSGATVPNEVKDTARGRKTTVNISDPFLAFCGDFAELTPINFFGIFGHDISSSGSWRVQLFSDVNQSGFLLYDSHFQNAWNFQGSGDFAGWESGRYFSVKYLQTTLDARSFCIYINDPEQASVKISRLWAGEFYSPPINMDYGLNFSFGDNVAQTRMESGSLFSENKTGFRKLGFTLSTNSTEEMETISNFVNIVGKRRDIFVSGFPEKYSILERNHTFLGKFKSLPGFVNDFFNNWNIKLELEEI